MRENPFTEQWYKEKQARVSGVGVKEHAANGGRGRGAVSERRSVGTMVKSSARTLRPTNLFAPYANKWELNYSKVLEMEQRVGAIKSWKYSGLTFTTAYRQYHRIDFIIGHNDRSIELAQVKGYHKNLRAGIKGLKWAAQMYPMFTWTIKWWTGTGWDGKYVEV